ncbi:MAG TPA: deoxyribonuclease II family protein, partial [Thermoanaerobaculia bacterium]|nr:deoxyribonuclease II family protein [Thermoanaerobaculia bacterium]
VPQLTAGAASDSASGYEYVYYDSAIDQLPDRDENKKVDKSPYVLNKDEGALNKTLDSVFAKYPKGPGTTVGWILYNDEMPEGVGRKDDAHKGHTKGVIVFDTGSGTGFWLLHSWPKFSAPGATSDPTPKYGQTYLCITLGIDAIRQLAAQMAIHQEPQIYYPNTANLPATDPLYVLTQPLASNPAADSNVISLTSRAGMPFKVIAKNREWNKDFWNDLVGPTLDDDMDDETWIRGPIPPVADSDGIHKTFDVKYVNLGALGAHWAWPETHDHAKWGITLHKPWICIGDINRMISQRKRGGGTIAFQNTTLWQALSKAGLLLAPPGMSRTDAHDFIKQTHHPHSEAPPRVPVAAVRSASTRKPSAKKASAKKASAKKAPAKKASAKAKKR